MIRIKPLWIGLMLVVCSILVIVIGMGGQATAAAVPVVATSSAPLSNSPGLPAIRPAALVGALSSTPHFTTTDVQVYLKTHAFLGGQVAQGAALSIYTIKFMTSKQASALLSGVETGLPATATVCYVKVRGPFVLAAPAPPGAKALPAAAYGVEIFDGQTGNILVWWTPSA